MITIYSKINCPYCVQAKALLDSLGAPYANVDLTNDQEKLIALSEKSGLFTVPQIFVDDECLGGFTDIQRLHQEGKLVPLLKL